MSNHAIIIFDGECSFCSNSVQFIIRHDKRCLFKFAPSQSEIAQQIRAAYHLDNITGTMILIKDRIAYTHSDAVLRTASELGFPWKVAKIFLLIPKSLRNPMYKLVSKNRQRFGSKKQTCLIPTDDIKKRFEINEKDWAKPH